MKKKALSILLVLCLTLSLGTGWIYAEPEDGSTETWSEETSDETADEWSEETPAETTEEYSEETEYAETDENLYDGEYSEGYSEEEAIQEWQQETPAETSESEGETEEQPVLPIVAPDGTIRKPVLSSGAAAVYCRNTGELVFAKNPDKRFSPYSITKLLTAFLAIQNLPMDQKVTISEEAAYQDGSTMNLLPGEEVNVEQLLYGTMILSGNDAAYALAETVSGDVDSFVNLMNATVRNLGCKNTNFVNPNGLIDDVSRHYTTARDFLEISKMVFANDTLKKIAGATEYEMPETNMHEAYKMEGHNELLLEGKSGYLAGKTGYWEDDKATIAMTYMEGTLDLIVVALGGDVNKRGTDCDQLIEYAVASVEGLKVVEKGQIVGTFDVKRGAVKTCEAMTDGESFMYLPKQASKELIQLVAVYNEEITAPVKAGDQVGVYEVYLADEKLDEVPLVAAADVEEGWILSRFGLSNKETLILGGFVLLFILLLIIRIINRGRMKKKKKLERQDKIRTMAEEEIAKEKKEFESYRGRYYN